MTTSMKKTVSQSTHAFNEPQHHIFLMSLALILLLTSALTLMLIGWQQKNQHVGLFFAGALMCGWGLLLARHLRYRKRCKPAICFSPQAMSFMGGSFFAPQMQHLNFGQIKNWQANQNATLLTLTLNPDCKTLSIALGMLTKSDRQKVIALMQSRFNTSSSLSPGL